MADIDGTDGNDSLTGSGVSESIDAKKGHDTVSAGAGNDKISGGEGNDQIDGGSGHDTIDAGEGNDLVLGGAGNDRIEGGEGTDTISGGEGNDSIKDDKGPGSIDGGAGDDTIETGDSADTITGGSGNDSIKSGKGDDDVQGGDGNDTIWSDEGNDTVTGGAGHDSIHGDMGDDLISGDAGNDRVYGGEGNDSIDGGDGADTIWGDKGNDSIQGGAGNDYLIGGDGSDTFILRDGHGTDTIGDFDEDLDVLAFDMDEIQSYQDVQYRMSETDDGVRITFNDGSFVYLDDVEMDDLSASNFSYDAGPICFHAGTLIDTPQGPCRIEMLRAGDTVVTLDRGPQPIRGVTRERQVYLGRSDPARPVLVAPHALGAGHPARPLTVSPQHRLLVVHPRSGAEHLVAACKLVGRPGIRRMNGRHGATYHNLLMDRHELVIANGCIAETLLLTPWSRSRLPLSVRDVARGVVHDGPARPILRHDPMRMRGAGPVALRPPRRAASSAGRPPAA